MDYLDEPGARQRAMSVASILTNTMEGNDRAFCLSTIFQIDFQIYFQRNQEY